MKKIFSGFKDEQDGAIAIEACISLTLFLIVMIALYSVIQVFTVQSMISHAMQEACQSMALENYNQSMFKTGTLQQIPSKVFDWISGGHRENFSTSADFSWKELLLPSSSTSGEAQTALYDSNAKQRFAAYLGGGVEKADELLKNYGVVGGLDGISFAGTEKSRCSTSENLKVHKQFAADSGNKTAERMSHYGGIYCYHTGQCNLS